MQTELLKAINKILTNQVLPKTLPKYIFQFCQTTIIAHHCSKETDKMRRLWH